MTVNRSLFSTGHPVEWTQSTHPYSRSLLSALEINVCYGRSIINTPSFARGFSYTEVLVALFILSIAIVPAMEALQSGIQGATIHQQTTKQHYALLSRIENILAESYGNLLSAAQTAGNSTTASSYSDPVSQTDRIIVYLSVYDADADPWTVTDPDNDGDSNIYTGDTSNLLWIKVTLENSDYAFESLRQR